MSNVYSKEVASFEFTKDTPDDIIFDICKNMGVPEKVALILISIKEKYAS